MIERKYYKLWIRSTEILLRHLHQDIYESSASEISNMINNIKYYARTSMYNVSYEKLRKNHIVVITGAPGVGKTSLAEQLCISSIVDGYECFIIIKNIEEAFSVLRREEKQVFYYDDFLGSNYLNTIEKNEDSNIVRFMRIVASQDKRFILTSRINILDHSYQKFQKLSDKLVLKNEFVINIPEYSYNDKLLILYSMLWKSDLNKELFEVFTDINFLNKVILHKNFNPRIIEIITNNIFLKNDNKEIKNRDEFIAFIQNNLDTPFIAWDNAFTHQLDDSSRILTKLVALSGEAIDENRLIDAYTYYINNFPLNIVSNSANDFYTVSKILCRSFLNKSISNERNIKYSPFNPSITDYIVGKLKNDHIAWVQILKSLNSCESLQFFIQASSDNENLKSIVATELLRLPRTPLEKSSAYYIADVALLLPLDIFKYLFGDNFYKTYFSIIKSYGIFYSLDSISKFIKKMLKYSTSVDVNLEIDVYMHMLHLCTSNGDFKALTSILISRNIENDTLKAEFHKELYNFWDNTIEDYASSVIDNYIVEHGKNVEANTEKLFDSIASEIEGMYVTLNEDEIKNIISHIDLVEIYSSFINFLDIYDEDNLEERTVGIDIESLLQDMFTIKYNS